MLSVHSPPTHLDGIQPSSDHHKLVCYYFDNKNDPRLVLQPVKVEVLYPDPKIYVLRDFISEVEMARLKELAAPKVSIFTFIGMARCTLLFLSVSVLLLLWGPTPAPEGYCQKPYHG